MANTNTSYNDNTMTAAIGCTNAVNDDSMKGFQVLLFPASSPSSFSLLPSLLAPSSSSPTSIATRLSPYASVFSPPPGLPQPSSPPFKSSLKPSLLKDLLNDATTTTTTKTTTYDSIDDDDILHSFEDYHDHQNTSVEDIEVSEILGSFIGMKKGVINNDIWSNNANWSTYLGFITIIIISIIIILSRHYHHYHYYHY